MRRAESSVTIILPFAELAARNAQVDDPVSRLIHRVHVFANHNACVPSHIMSDVATEVKLITKGDLVPSSGE
jgi:hypothetical protein